MYNATNNGNVVHADWYLHYLTRCSARDRFSSLKNPSFGYLYLKYIYNFVERIDSCSNFLIQSCASMVLIVSSTIHVR